MREEPELPGSHLHPEELLLILQRHIDSSLAFCMQPDKLLAIHEAPLGCIAVCQILILL